MTSTTLHRLGLPGISKVELTAAAARRLWWLALAALAVPALNPFIAYGAQDSFGGAVHLLRLTLLDYHILHGTLYPRWLPELLLGRGAPILNYYAPLSYYLCEIFHLAGLDFSSALMAGMAALVIIAGWGMFVLARDVFGSRSSWAAFVAAVAYMYAPYLLFNVFVGNGIPELGAQAALPWVFWSLRRLVRDPKPERFALPAIVSLGALVLVHNLTLLLVPPILAAYLLVLWREVGWERRRLGWVALAVGLAAGLTSFFWAPAILERGFLNPGAYDIALNLFLPNNAWHWNNFLDLGVRFNYNFGMPVQLGLVELLLAFAGAVMARRRDPEWLFLIGASVLTAASIGAWTLPLWSSNWLLVAVEFPWRLLTLTSLCFALLTGGIVCAFPSGAARTGASLVVLGVVIFANSPRLGWVDRAPAVYADLTPARVAQYEKETGALGGRGYTSEFNPRWAGDDYFPQAGEPPLSSLNFDLHSASSFMLNGTVTSPAGGRLLLTQFYFPGWQVTLDHAISLPTYPSKGTGLLAVDIPAGSHVLSIAWAGTRTERAADIATLLALLALAWFAWQRLHARGPAVLALALCIAGVALFVRPSPVDPVQAPDQPLQMMGMRLAGYRVERERPDALTVFPYWFVNSRQPDYQIRWDLEDPAGHALSEVVQTPYFNTTHTSQWAAGTLVTDAVDMPLPASLPAGRYLLYAQSQMGSQDGSLQPLGGLELPPASQNEREPAPAHPEEARFGDGMFLAGYDMSINGRPARSSADPAPSLLHAGDVLGYTLYWRAAGPITQNYRARVELVNSAGVGVSGLEQVPGGLLNEPTTWDQYRLRTDTYQVIVPTNIQDGLYNVQVRAYDRAKGQILEVTDGSGVKLGDHLVLHEAKALVAPDRTPQHALQVRIGDFGTLAGYDLSPEAATLQPGGTFTVTLYYKAGGPAPSDYTRFLHLSGPAPGNAGTLLTDAAQQDSYPAAGANPTGSWVPGETVVDPVRLTVSESATPGEYALVFGFYDLRAGASRLPLRDSSNQPLPDKQLILAGVTVHQRAGQ
jgi:hypothetical protein